MKTAISLPDDLFREVEELAKEQHFSRSEVFVVALREFLERRRSGQLLASLNKAYATAETPEEYSVRQKSKRRYVKTSRRARP